MWIPFVQEESTFNTTANNLLVCGFRILPMVLGSATVIYCVLIVRFRLPVPVGLFFGYRYLGGIRGYLGGIWGLLPTLGLPVCIVPVVLYRYLEGIRGLLPGSVCIFRAL